jgi:uncharacterized protein (DUF302 family)
VEGDVKNPDGILSRLSPLSTEETIDQIVSTLQTNNVTLFATIDHSGEAERAGLTLRNTKLLIFGSPAAGTPLMQENRLIALDLPLKVLVWEDEDDQVWMTYLAGSWLADRYGVDPNLAKVLSAIDGLVDHIASSPT